MALFNGVAIADPSKKQLNFVTKEGFRSEVEGLNSDQRSSTNKNLKSTVIGGVTSSVKIVGVNEQELHDPQLPHITNGDQIVFRRFTRQYDTVKGYRTIDFDTVPITNARKTVIEEDRVYAQRNQYKVDVEEPVLETGKVLTNMNGEAYYDSGLKERKNYSQLDPKSFVFRHTAKFDRPKTSSPTMMTNPNDYAREKHYVFVNGDQSYRDVMYKNSPWKDSTGRMSLFEAPRTATRLA